MVQIPGEQFTHVACAPLCVVDGESMRIIICILTLHVWIVPPLAETAAESRAHRRPRGDQVRPVPASPLPEREFLGREELFRIAKRQFTQRRVDGGESYLGR